MEGSKTIKLTVMYEDIIDRVRSGSYYIGESTKASLQEVAAMLQASSDDDTVLLDYLKESATKASNVLQRYMGETVLNKTNKSTGTSGPVDSVLYTIKATANAYGDTVSSTVVASTGLTKAVKDYMTNYILREWTKPIPATSNQFAKKVVQNEQTIKELSCYREKPTRA